MSLTRRDVARLSLLGLAALMVATGFVLSRSGAGQSLQAIGKAGPPRSPQAVEEPVERETGQEEAEETEVAPAASDPESAREPAPESKKPASAASKTKQRPVAWRPVAREALPPFSASIYQVGPADEPASGPPPDVLWLSGVIQGEPKVALFRRGGDRYLVKEGDVVDDKYRVLEISANSVTLQRGSRKQTLRVGEY